MVFIQYKHIGSVLEPRIDPGLVDYTRFADAGPVTVNSEVIAAAIGSPQLYPLEEVSFTLKHSEVPFLSPLAFPVLVTSLFKLQNVNIHQQE